jgi:hypothetical protein
VARRIKNNLFFSLKNSKTKQQPSNFSVDSKKQKKYELNKSLLRVKTKIIAIFL